MQNAITWCNLSLYSTAICPTNNRLLFKIQSIVSCLFAVGVRNLRLLNFILKPVHFKKFSGADQGFGQGELPASEAESCQCSEAESHDQSKQCVAGIQGLLKGPGSFWGFNCRDSFSLIFDIYFNTKS